MKLNVAIKIRIDVNSSLIALLQFPSLVFKIVKLLSQCVRRKLYYVKRDR